MKLDDLSNADLLSELPARIERDERGRRRYETMSSRELLFFAEYCRRNLTNNDPVTYEGAMRDAILPELFQRFLALVEEASAKPKAVAGSKTDGHD